MRSERKDIVINKEVTQKILLVILCVVAFQPLVGLTARFNSVSYDIFMSQAYNHFLKKALFVRYNGYIALITAVFIAGLSEKLSLMELLKKTYYRKPWNTCFTLLFIWVIISAFFVAPLREEALNGESYRFEGLFNVIAYAGFFAAASLLENQRYKKIWMNFTVAVSTFLGICSLYSLWADNPIVLSYMYRQFRGEGPLTATFLQFNHYAYYLCVVILLLAGLFVIEEKKAKKILYLVLFGFHEYVLAVNGTRGATLAAIIGIIVLAVLDRIRNKSNLKNYFLMFLVFGIVSFLPGTVFGQRFFTTFTDMYAIVEEGDGGSGRWILWKTTIELWLRRPIQGYGINMSYYALYYEKGMQDMPHNEYLQHALDLGLIGISLYLGALGSLFFSTIKKVKEMHPIILVVGCTALAYGVSAFFGVTIPQVLPFFYVLLGFVKHSGAELPEENQNDIAIS